MLTNITFEEVKYDSDDFIYKRKKKKKKLMDKIKLQTAITCDVKEIKLLDYDQIIEEECLVDLVRLTSAFKTIDAEKS